jgi:hypothetical protein
MISWKDALVYVRWESRVKLVPFPLNETGIKLSSNYLANVQVKYEAP